MSERVTSSHVMLMIFNINVSNVLIGSQNKLRLFLQTQTMATKAKFIEGNIEDVHIVFHQVTTERREVLNKEFLTNSGKTFCFSRL